jgi:hypothetical protein
MDTLLKILIVIIGGAALILLISFLLSWPIYMLWNGCLVGAVDGVHELTWLQAWGISVLFGLLFKPTFSNSSDKK